MAEKSFRGSAGRACKEAKLMIGIGHWCALWRQDGKERRSSWFISRAGISLEIIKKAHAPAIIFQD